MSEKMIKVGISQGDINGISYELILKTFDDIRMYESCIPVVYGSSKVLGYHRKALDLPPININNIAQAKDAGFNRLNVINCGNEDIAVAFSQATPESEKFAESAFSRAVDDLKTGKIDVLVSAPSNQDEITYIEEQSGEKVLNMLISDSFRIALATNKIPLAEVPSGITVDLLKVQLQILRDTLIHDFMITLPRIAVLSLNPGASVSEHQFGKEENEIIIPAIKEANNAGVICFGPYSSDSFFATDNYQKFDAILAMYYDQGLTPFRSLSVGRGVCYAANLPFVRTTPDQGPCYERAGKNESTESLFREAIFLAIDIFNARILDKEIYANPLKKQYFERGSDNEKLDLTKEE
ncbi:MAG: 4-hydroxythreonine-4-phosphate dehydrogenase PdxA [Candidatus Symbiothrix sp.]|jgi:4-hydroxythreonine-4-phosphate dehydrogenase|nr:4-hydroxythreonine-4-phosphate dehydrogenase PdxA [Candidatus Symbiothrix sp.]